MTLLLTALLWIMIYFLPYLIAQSRHHQSAIGIFILNFLLGWTVLFWIISLVWACSATHAQVIYVPQGGTLCTCRRWRGMHAIDCPARGPL